MAKVREFLGISQAEFKPQPTPLLVLPKCRIGLEYEWEKTNKYIHELESADVYPPTVKAVESMFSRHEDGSLRDRGTEFVFKNPYQGTQIIAAVRAMEECARTYDFAGSYRTSLHVHIDAQDLDFPKDLVLLGGVYCLAEPFMYDFVGNNRASCNYCTPWYSHNQHYEAFLSSLVRQKDFAAPGFFAAKYKQLKTHKYSGFNFFSLGDFGTVEFRHAPVTMQADKIITWINLIMSLKAWVMDHSGMTVEGLINEAGRRGYGGFLPSVFGAYTTDLTRYTREVPGSFKLGLGTLYNYALLA